MTNPGPSKEITTAAVTAVSATATPPTALRRRRPAGLLSVLPPLVLAVALTACSGDGDADRHQDAPRSTRAEEDGDAQAYIDAGVASLTADEKFPLDQETATCISTAAVDLIGADALARAGVSPQEFADAGSYDILGADIPDDGVAQLSESLDGCNVAGAFTSIFAAGLGVELPPDASACLDEHVDRHAVNDAMAGGFLAPSGEAGQAALAGFEDTLETALIDAVIACPPVVAAVFLADAPGTVTPETQACLSGLVEANPDRARAAFSGDSAAAEDLGSEIGTTCAGTLG